MTSLEVELSIFKNGVLFTSIEIGNLEHFPSFEKISLQSLNSALLNIDFVV